MGLWDILPGVSQVKSIVQLACGDTEGAARTQEAFLRECPGVSQVTSAVQVLAGDTEGAIETQKRCGSTLLKTGNGMLNGTPGVGHVKGLLHYAVGDTNGGHEAMKAATRTTGVMAGGVGGFVVGGPAGAVAGGIYGGVFMDTTTSAVTNKPYGYIAAIDNLAKNPNPGDVFDTLMMPVGDGLTGYTAGQTYNRMTANRSSGSKSASGQPSKADVQKGQAMQARAEADLSGRLNDGLKAPDGMSEGQYQLELRKNAEMYNEGRSLQGFKNKPSASAAKGVANGKTQVNSGKTGQATPSVTSEQGYVLGNECNANRSGHQKQQQTASVRTNQSAQTETVIGSFEAHDMPNHRVHYSNLHTQLVGFFKNLSKEKRENSNNVIQITQKIYDEFRNHISTIRTIIRVRDLYVIRVSVFDSNANHIVTQTSDGEVDNYAKYAIRNGGLNLVPYRYFHIERFFRSPGSLLVSQAVFISEAVRFAQLVFDWTLANRFANGFVTVTQTILNIIKSWSRLSKENSELVVIRALDNDKDNDNDNKTDKKKTK